MAYDEELADRIRELVAGEAGLTEQKMFGGLAFLDRRQHGGRRERPGRDARPRRPRRSRTRSSRRPPPGRWRCAAARCAGWLRVDTEDVAHEARARASGSSAARLRPLAAAEALTGMHELTKQEARRIAVRAQLLDAPRPPTCSRTCGT